MQSRTGRFWEIDFLRGIAVIMMLVYHFLADLEYLKPNLLITDTAFWNCFQKMTATLFLVLAGLSLSIRYARNHPSFYPFYVRGLKIFGWGCLITLATRLTLSEGFVRFGILHLIGLSTILSYPLFRLNKANLPVAIASITAGLYLNRVTFSFSSLVWLGFVPRYFFSVDYFPFFPWFGLFVLGIFLGQALYSEGHPVFSLRDYSSNRAICFISFLGKHTLPIYLIHQPVFLAVIYIFLYFIKTPV